VSEPTKTVRWSVVIPTWQRSTLLRGTLESLGEQELQDFEVVVVCDGDDAPTRSFADAYRPPFPIRWVHHPENRGQAAARNTGAVAARGTHLLFLDDDVIASPGLLACHDRAHSEAPEWLPRVVFGRTIEERRVPIVSRTDAYMQASWERDLESFQPPDGSPDLTSVGEQAEARSSFGFNGSIARELFLEIGGFDARLRSDEDMELGLRLYRRGVRFCYARDATVRHQDTKPMHDYYARCWRASGSQDVYRVREKGQRSAQVSQLAKLRHGSYAARQFTRLASRHPRLFLTIASALEAVTDMTGSRTSFGLWARLRRPAEYWTGVRAAGITPEEAMTLAGASGRILAFHCIARPRATSEISYCTSPARFRKFLARLRALGRVAVSADRWLRGDLPESNVLLTFDDAFGDFYTEVFPEIERFRLAPLVFVVVDRIGKTNDWEDGSALGVRPLLTLEQIRELQRHGVAFGAHSLTHRPLPTLPDDELRRQVTDSKRKLEDLIGAPVEWFAYPYGEVDRRVRAAVAEAGYKAAVTTRPGLNGWQDPLALKRLEMSDEDTPLDLALKVELGWSVLRSIRSRLR
jgi:GT2 family glycosyltransferase/peptidoglycan/xylan/chitin deacetylase (PgdA/CDA1 family)